MAQFLNMARFDVYKNPGKNQTAVPWVLDVQSTHLDALATRIVVPLRRRDAFPQISLPADLIPVFTIHGIACMLDSPQLAAIPKSALKQSVANLAEHQTEITASLDRLFGGF